MKISERCAQNPAAVAAAAAIVLLFGMLSLLRLPIQLLPDTRRPELFINAEWREAAPSELEEAIIEPIEEAMRGLPGMVEMRSESNRGQGGVGLTFEIGTDMTRVMLDVVSRLNTLPPLPPDAEEPQVFGGDNWQTENAGSLLVKPLPGHSVPDIGAEYQKLMEEVVEPRLCARAGRVARQSRRRSPARGPGHLRSAPPRGARADTAAAGADRDRRERRLGGLCQCRPSAVHRARDRSGAGGRSGRPGRRLERRAAALPARRRRRAHRTRQGTRLFLPQRRARVLHHRAAHVGVEHRRADRRRQAGDRGPQRRPARQGEPVDRAVLGCERLRAARDRLRAGEPRHRHPARGRRTVVFPARSTRAGGDRPVDPAVAVLRRHHAARCSAARSTSSRSQGSRSRPAS